MKNPTPWASFENMSVWYAERCLRRVQQLSACATLIQRTWRQRILPTTRRKIYPIFIGWREVSVMECAKELLCNDRADPALMTEVFAFEKLDGTNLGVRCDGAVFGRRMKVEGTFYQKVPVEGAIPTQLSVQAIKASLAKTIDMEIEEMPMLVLYGELMCNPGRYDYEERGMGKQWLCFGAVFAPYNDGDSDTEGINHIAAAERLTDRLQEHGFLATMSSENGKVKLKLNPAFVSMVEQNKIQCASLIDAGTLWDVCLRQQKVMMGTQFEGLVLTGHNFLKKWKTGKEDESKGHELFYSIMNDIPSSILDLAGVDAPFARCLMKVSGNKPMPKQTQPKRNKENVPPPYDKQILDKAVASAMSKYDSLDVYFARGETKMIKSALVKEVVDDLGATAAMQIKCIDRAVGKLIGTSIAKWKKEIEERACSPMKKVL